MKKTALAIVLVLICTAALAACSAPAASASQPAPAVTAAAPATADAPTVTVSGTGKQSVTPDMATMTFGAETTKPTAAEATAEINKVSNALTDKLKSLGIADADMQTSGYTLSQQYAYDNNGKPTGTSSYSASISITVKLYAMDKIGTTIDEAVKAGANNNYGIQFGLKDETKNRGELSKLAVADAKSKAESYAAAAGMKLGGIVSITDGNGSGNILYTAKTASANDSTAAAIAPGALDSSLDVTIVYSLTK